MKNKYVIPVKQRASILKEVEARFRECEEKCREHATGQYAFLYLLSTAMVLTDDYEFTPEKRFEAINRIKEQFIELSEFLSSNKCQIGHSKQEVYDVEANLSYIERFCNQYGMAYNEEIFNELSYE